MKKRIITLGLSLLLATTPLMAKPQYEYIEKKESEKIAADITHEKILSFTSDGFRGIHVVHFNVHSSTVKLVPLFNGKTVSKADTVSNMAEQRQVVAGINGDFFNFTPMFPLGMLVENGEMIYSNSPSEHPTPSFLLAKDGSMTMGRVEVSMELVVGDKTIPISSINKPNGYGSTGAYSSKWGPKSRGGKVNSQTEIAIKDGRVIARIDGGEPLDIPQGGYVVNIKDGLYLPQVGESARIQISGINIDNIAFGIGAGSVILKDGQITNTHIDIKGRHPRTALGINKETGDMYLVTVDGRSIYHGMDTAEVAELLLKLGCTDGFNLDGGGSTTLVLRDVNTGKVKVENHISSERKVANGLGLQSSSPVGEPVTMKIITEGEKLFKNTTKWINVKLYDASGNPVKADLSQIQMKASLPAHIQGHSFRPQASGEMSLTVQYGALQETVNFQVLENPSVLLLDQDTLSLGTGESYAIPDVLGIDAVGNRALIRGHELKVEVIGNVGKISQGTFFRNEEKTNGAIALSFGGAKHRIIISKQAKKVGINALGNLKGIKALATPAKARAALSTIEDKRPLTRLWFNFEEATEAKQAILSFQEAPKMPADTTELSVFVKNLGDLVLKATVSVDGQDVVVDFTENLELGGYTEYRGKLPGSSSIHLKNFFVSELEGKRTPKGYIDIKDVAAVVTPDTSSMYTEYRSDFYDHLRTNGLSTTDIAVVVAGDKAEKEQLTKHFGTHGSIAIVNGNGYANGNVQKERIHQEGNALFVNFKNTKGGLRATDINQWNELLTTVKHTTASNIIVTMEGGAKGDLGFINPIESALFKETLEDFVHRGKRVLVVTNLKEPTTTRFEEGIRYINLNPEDTEILALNINRIGDNILYAIQKVNTK